MKWIICCLALIMSNLYAETVFLKNHRFAELYQEGDIYRLDIFQIEPGKLQEKIASKTFHDYHEVQNYISEHQALKSMSLMELNALATTEVQGQSLWKVTNSWNEEWERKYTQWLSLTLTKDFFVRHNISVDCADVVYSLRWIFARIHHLPAAATLAGTKVVISHQSIKRSWMRLKTHKLWYKDQRFLAAIEYLNNNTYTKTLPYDAYPVAINPLGVDVGAMYLTPGHVEIISRIDRQGTSQAPIYRLGSTTPKKARLLHENIMLEMTQVKQIDGGIFRFRWPRRVNGKWMMANKSSMPHYSLEQYSPDFSGEEGFSLTMAKRLGIAIEPAKIIKSSIEDAANYVEFRKVITRDGFNYCQRHNCQRNTWYRDLHATRARDRKLTKKMDRVYKLVKYFSQENSEYESYIEKYFTNRTVTILDTPITLEKIHYLFKMNLVSHDPRDTLERRWGLE